MSELWSPEKTLSIFRGMAAEDLDSAAQFYQLVNGIVRRDIGSDDLFPSEKEVLIEKKLESGFCSAVDSLGFLTGQARVGGFLRAIAREPEPITVLDAGCGSSALLGIASAIFHPKSEVMCVELNEAAANCASEVVEACGLSNRITVVRDNLLTMQLPVVDLAVSETFGCALLSEQGPNILSRIAPYAGRLLPSHVKIFASDELDREPKSWQPAAIIDFRDFNGVIEGELIAVGNGDRTLKIWAGYYAESDGKLTPVLSKPNSDSICNMYSLGRISSTVQRGSEIRFSYRPAQRGTIEIKALV